MNLLGQANLLFQNNQIKQAEQIYRQLLKSNPNDIDALWGLGKVALALDSYQPSYDIFQRCVQLSPHIPPLWLSLSQACQKLHRFEQAEQALLKAYAVKADYCPSLLALAIFYCQSNRLKEASNYLDQLYSIEPDNVRVFCLKVRIKTQNKIDTYAQAFLTKLMQKETLYTHAEQILLHYAFAKLFQSSKNYSQAFQHYELANNLQAKQASFKVADMSGFFNQLTETFSAEFIKKIEQRQQANPKALDYHVNNKTNLIPIFIVGQPRSGSTLLEQMLISHTDISSAGELPFLAGDIAQGILQLTTQGFPKGCKQLTLTQCRTLGEHYLANMQAIAPNAKFIIDKMPANYQSIGLIKMLLPHAKVIHISREAKSVSWSIYTNHFDVPEPYFCSMSEITQYHQCYQRVMSHWQQVMPEFIHHITYEHLVSSPKEALTSLLKFCALNYQTACLDFTAESRFIDTLSDVQLRAGLKYSSEQAWLPYKNFLPTCFDELI